MKKAITILLISIYAQVCGQNQNNFWYFGEYAGLNFNIGTPEALNDGEIFTTEGSATISDSEGNLQFYTDGVSVWDVNHDQMSNGFGLAGHGSSSQAALIVPQPGNCNGYYVFTTPSQDTLTPLSYSEVDMTLNGGLGDITVKNVALHSPISEKLTGVLHSNGEDYWVIAHEYGSAAFLSFLVTSSGVSITPITSNVGIVHTAPGYIDAHGYLKASSDGSKLCIALTNSQQAELLDFDNSTGIISNPFSIDSLPSNPYGVEFSPDNSKLYISSIGMTDAGVYQYDLSLGFSVAEVSLGTDHLIYGALQLAPDGKIYVNQLTKKYLGTISNPNLLGADCNYSDSTLSLDSGQCQDGLPNFIKKYSSCKGVTSLEALDKSVGAIIFPNPINEGQELNLEFTNLKQENSTLTFYDTQGRLVKTVFNITSNKLSIDTGNLASGLYFFQLSSEKQVLFSGKLMISHSQ